MPGYLSNQLIYTVSSYFQKLDKEKQQIKVPIKGEYY